MKGGAGGVLRYTEDLFVEESGGPWRSRRQPVPARIACRTHEAHPVSQRPSKTFHCEVVNETITATLRRKTSLHGSGDLFVRCSETDCQYVDANEPPCPLTTALFAAEIEERLARRLG